MREIPKLMFRRGFMMRSIIFVLLFSLVFLAIYQPFSDTAWIDFLSAHNRLVTLLFYIVCVSVMIVSKQVMAWRQSHSAFSHRLFVVWMLAEFVSIGLIYTLFTALFFDTAITVSLVCRISASVAMILAIPYAFVYMYAQYQGKKEELELIMLQRQTRTHADEKLVHFYDSNGVLKISIDENAIYYVVSQDNYVQIYYELNGQLCSYMLRCRTQRLEEMLSDTSLVRCHRSYIVNIKKVQFYKNEHDHGTITLSHADARQIPVSKSYYKSVTSRIAQWF